MHPLTNLNHDESRMRVFGVADRADHRQTRKDRGRRKKKKKRNSRNHNRSKLRRKVGKPTCSACSGHGGRPMMRVNMADSRRPAVYSGLDNAIICRVGLAPNSIPIEHHSSDACYSFRHSYLIIIIMRFCFESHFCCTVTVHGRLERTFPQ